MPDVSGNLGQITQKEIAVLAGTGPHVVRTEALKAGQDDLAAGLLVALDAAGEIVPWDEAQTAAAGAGDGAEKTFTGELGPIERGSLSIADGTETFTDDGFGTLTGDATGTGSVDYDSGAFAITFNAAPANEAEVAASYKPALKGVLRRAAAADAGVCDVVVWGRVVRDPLAAGETAPTTAQLRRLERLGIWAEG